MGEFRSPFLRPFSTLRSLSERASVLFDVFNSVTSSNYGSLIALALSAVDHLNATRQEGLVLLPLPSHSSSSVFL